MLLFHHLKVFVTLLCLAICSSSLPAEAQTLRFETLLATARKKSFDLKIARENVQATRAAVGEARAAYYPQVSLRFGNEYVHVFHENGNVVSVGDAIIADTASGYKHSLIAGFSYDLFDFGVRRLTVETAGRKLQIADLEQQQADLDLCNELLDRYASALKVQKQISVLKSICRRQNKIFRLSKRLRQAGTVGREQLGSVALDLAETLSRLNELKVRYQNALESLTLYTRQAYSSEETRLADLVQPAGVDTEIDLESLPELQMYQRQIENKQAELAQVQRSRLPQLTLYGSYRMFGTDAHSFTRSISGLSARDASVTLYLDWPLFDGFASRAKIVRLEHELAGLRYRKQKKTAELQQKFATLINRYQALPVAVKDQQRQLTEITERQNDSRLLAAQQITDRISFQQKMIQLARQQLEVELQRVDSAASTLALSFMHKVLP